MVRAPIFYGLAIVALGAGVVLFACDDDAPGPIQCLALMQAAPPAVDAGASSVITLSAANPDVDNAATLTVAWSVTGGGTLDQPVTAIDLVAQTDPYGNPGGIAGSVTNTFRARGPSGSYTVHASIDPGGGCIGAEYDAVIQVNGMVDDAGPSIDASTDGPRVANVDGATTDAADGAADTGSDAIDADASDAPDDADDASDAPVDG